MGADRSVYTVVIDEIERWTSTQFSKQSCVSNQNRKARDR